MSESADRRWAVVAGGSGGLGRAIAAAMARDGWNIVVTYHSRRGGAEATADLIENAGGESLLRQIDLVDADAVAATLAEVATAVDIAGAVYAAGPNIPMNFIAKTPPSVFAQQINQDLLACYNFLHPLLPELRNRRGVISAIVTPVIIRYTRMDLLSSGPKAGVQAIIRGIAAEEGRFGVRANSVGVGVVKGEGLWNTLIDSGDFTDKGLQQAQAAMPLGHFGAPEDVGEAISFLMSARARWITGQTLNVDGGYSV